jgi:hypothetical protein
VLALAPRVPFVLGQLGFGVHVIAPRRDRGPAKSSCTS